MMKCCLSKLSKWRPVLGLYRVIRRVEYDNPSQFLQVVSGNLLHLVTLSHLWQIFRHIELHLELMLVVGDFRLGWHVRVRHVRAACDVVGVDVHCWLCWASEVMMSLGTRRDCTAHWTLPRCLTSACNVHLLKVLDAPVTRWPGSKINIYFCPSFIIYFTTHRPQNDISL